VLISSGLQVFRVAEGIPVFWEMEIRLSPDLTFTTFKQVLLLQVNPWISVKKMRDKKKKIICEKKKRIAPSL
jgi:hypothetical protein